MTSEFKADPSPPLLQALPVQVPPSSGKKKGPPVHRGCPWSRLTSESALSTAADFSPKGLHFRINTEIKSRSAQDIIVLKKYENSSKIYPSKLILYHKTRIIVCTKAVSRTVLAL